MKLSDFYRRTLNLDAGERLGCDIVVGGGVWEMGVGVFCRLC